MGSSYSLQRAVHAVLVTVRKYVAHITDSLVFNAYTRFTNMNLLQKEFAMNDKSYESRISTLEETVESFKKKYESLEKRHESLIKKYEFKISTLEETIASLKKEISDLWKYVFKLEEHFTACWKGLFGIFAREHKPYKIALNAMHIAARRFPEIFDKMDCAEEKPSIQQSRPSIQ